MAKRYKQLQTGNALPFHDVSRARDKQYHYECVMALLQRYGTNASYQQVRIADAYEAFHNNQSVSSYQNQLQQYDINLAGQTGNPAHKGEVPYIWIRLGQIRAKVGVLEGDLIRKGFRPQVRAINQDALSRKAEFRMKVKADVAFKPYARELDEVLGQGPMAEPQNVPDSLAQVEDFVQKNYKDQAAVVMQAILVYSIEYYRYRELRLKLFLDAVIAGRCHASVEVRAGYPQWKYYNPLRVVTDSFGESDHRDEDTCFLVCDYQSPEDIAEEFGLDMAQLQEIYERHQKGKLDYNGLSMNNSGAIYGPFQEEGNSVKVLVIRAQWVDRKKAQAKITKDKHGNEHVHTVYGEDDKKKKLTAKEEQDGGAIEMRLVKTVREAVVVAGDMTLNWGEATNQIRRIDNPTETMLDLCTWVPYSINGRNVSLVEMVSPLYALKEFFWTKIQLEISKSGGRGISIDASQLPREWGDATTAVPIAMYYLKGAGVHIRTGAADTPPGERSIEDFDMSVGNAIEAFLRLSEALDAEAGEMIGVTPTRQGEIVSANQLSGVTAQANAQASLVTLGMYEGFKHYESRLMTKFLEKAKICWALNPERFRPAIGDLNFEFIKKNVDVHLQDYGVFVYAEPIDKQKLEMFVMSAISAGLPAHIGLKVMQIAEEDVQRAIDFFYKQSERVTESMQQQAMALEQQKGQNSQAKGQLDLQKAVAPAQIKAETDLELADRNNAASLREKQMDAISKAGQATQSAALEIFKQGMEDLRKQREAQDATATAGNS